MIAACILRGRDMNHERFRVFPIFPIDIPESYVCNSAFNLFSNTGHHEMI